MSKVIQIFLDDPNVGSQWHTADDVTNQTQNKARLSPSLIKYIAKTKITA